jgi:hypothetical protein
MPSGPTNDLIASTTLSSAANSITFSSIPQTYTDIVSVWYVPNTSGQGQDIFCRVNGATGVYGFQSLDGYATSVTAARSLSGGTNAIPGFQYGYTDTANPFFITSNFSNYANTTFYKNINSIVQAGYSVSTLLPVTTNINVYQNVSAITSLQFFLGGSLTMAIGSVISLYGIKAA